LQQDVDPQVRGLAAEALGQIASSRAIPALLATLEKDHECDQLGHPPSSSAARALNTIVCRVRKIPRWPKDRVQEWPGLRDLDLVKKTAAEIFQESQHAS
jgi:hypothetical protein